MIGVCRGTRSRRLAAAAPITVPTTPHILSRSGRCFYGSFLLLLACCCQPAFVSGADFPEMAVDADRKAAVDSDLLNQPLADVLIEGNKTVSTSQIRRQIKAQAGRPVTEQQIREDLRSLYDTRWFFSAERRYRMTDDGLVLIYRVVERPRVTRVEYRGNTHIKTKNLEKICELKVEDPYDVTTNHDAARRIEEEYRKKGFAFAKVTLLKGDSKDDREVVFLIDEGKKLTVMNLKFTGNEFRYAYDGLLKTKLRTKRAFLGVPLLGGKYDPSTIEDDIAALKQYYNDLGFFDVDVKHRVSVADVRFNPLRKGSANVTIEYLISEGERYRLRDIEFEGNRIFSDGDLRQDLQLASGEYFNARKLNTDARKMRSRYGKLGRLFATVETVPQFLEQPGVVDLVYRIDEDRVYHIRRVNVQIEGDHPHTRQSVVLNRILTDPGDPADPELIRRSERRLENEIFERGPANGPRVQISKVPDLPVARSEDGAVRGQSPESVLPQPANPMYQNMPQGDPFGRALEEPPPGWIDLDYHATEARTGRLMFGVGVNSDAGVVGSVILEEHNFDIMRPPHSWRDIANGTAWRGAGQRLRLEAVPGDIVSRYVISWSDPYFLNTDYSFGLSAFYYNRYYPDWDENRAGGRISLGRQFTHEISVSGALRLERVEFLNPDSYQPELVQKALGESFFSSLRVSAAHDTRDTPYLPAEGHFLQASFEQAVGDFQYPRAELEARQYFTTFSRPDGTGRHVLTLHGQLGWTDVDTPIFERFFAGGFQSFRGFAYRGVTPREFGIGIGGRWMALGGAEYKLPLTADEMVSLVAFTDVGTVEKKVAFEEFRVSVGVGLRLQIPAMGPAPIALDWAIPVAKTSFDDERLFSFYIGLNR